MSIKLDALIRKTEEDLAAERDPKRRAALQVSLGGFVATRAALDKDKPPGDGDGDGDGDGEGDDDKAAKHAEAARKMKAKAKALEHRAKARRTYARASLWRYMDGSPL